MKTTNTFHWSDVLWDAWCIASVIGIWPRFIEPNLLDITHLKIQIVDLPQDLNNFKILQFSDLHINKQMTDTFLKKISNKIASLKPDLIVFTGDFLCYGKTNQLDRLERFLNTLSAPYGCFAILGNHDYDECVSINEKGEYDVLRDDTSIIKKGFSRLFTSLKLAKRTTERALLIPPNQALLETLKRTPFKLLHNENAIISKGEARLNVCGLGEYVLGRTKPQEAFAGYDTRFPGIILLHNPDGIRLIDEYPGELILCGHTHGGQVYLPWMWKKFTLMENMTFIKGYERLKEKSIYINRGVGGVMKFRWRARPELLLTTLLKGESLNHG